MRKSFILKMSYIHCDWQKQNTFIIH